MKFKYRLILRGDNRYSFQYKRKGFLEYFDPWISTYLNYATENEAMESMLHVLKIDNEEHNKKYFKVIKVMEND